MGQERSSVRYRFLPSQWSVELHILGHQVSSQGKFRENFKRIMEIIREFSFINFYWEMDNSINAMKGITYWFITIVSNANPNLVI